LKICLYPAPEHYSTGMFLFMKYLEWWATKFRGIFRHGTWSACSEK